MKKTTDSAQNSALTLLKGREMVFNALESGTYSIPPPSRPPPPPKKKKKNKQAKESEESDNQISYGY